MNYTPSVNIELGSSDDFQYIVTPNAKSVFGNIVSSYNSGIHSFSIIGTYGTGKSSFLLALENDLKKGTSVIVSNSSIFNNANTFEFINIVGDYTPLSRLLSNKLGIAYLDDTQNLVHPTFRVIVQL